MESRSSSSATKVSPGAASSSLDSTIDPRLLPRVLEHKASFGSSRSPRRVTLARRQSSTHRSRSRGSQDGSPTGYTVQVYSEKPPEHVPQRLRRREPKARTQRPRWSSMLNADGTSISHNDAPNQETVIGASPRAKKPRGGGLRGTFRRLFGRKSSKDRISLPAPVPYPQHVSPLVSSSKKSDTDGLQGSE